ncbi:hypothetical protein ADEAN_000463400 [Angomonas deanei]|uniref:Uncharacterized protein n=1 Tax=Angomonas deanei TaxID=59799 RepID=A0A7G2CBH3_9TRYP|nr:hypothetical protein ADEAN_000463400 [Angomonas deanei]
MTQVGKRARETGPDKEEASESLREAVKDVNHNVVSLLLDKYDKANEESLHFRDHWETSVKRFIARQKDYVSLRLNELTTEKRYELSNLTQQASVAHLETSAVDAANSVLDRLTALQSFNNYASRMLEGEQDRNRTLLEDLSLFLSLGARAGDGPT